MLLEDWGSWCEWLMDKRANRNPKGEHERNWYRYLCLTFDHEPVGHRYLRTLVLRLKFELDCGIAFLMAALGTQFTSFGSWRLVMSLALMGGYLLLFEAWTTQRRLSKLREELLNGLDSAPTALRKAAG